MEQIGTAADGQLNFGSETYQAIRSKVQNSNLIYSPFSLSTALEMLYHGCEGESKEEIKKILSLEDDEGQNSQQKIMESINEKDSSSSDGFILTSANRIFLQTGFEVKKKFSDLLTKSFATGIESLNFQNSAESALKINEWVSASTNQKIKNLVTPDSLSGDTKLFLANAIYFKGLWAHKFDAENTAKCHFYLGNVNNKVEVDMMYKEHKFPYCELNDINAQAVALPYINEKLFMVIIVPNEIEGLSKIEQGILNSSFFDFFDNMTTHTKVGVSLPRFKIETSLELTDSLKAIGLNSIFSSSANLKGISNEPLSVSSIVQKCFIEINEEGTEAAASTGCKMMKRSLPVIIPFRADRPFYFRIFDKSSKIVLFSGVCENPLQN